MPTITIPKEKTYFYTRFFSDPASGKLTFKCPNFFNVTGGTKNYNDSSGDIDTIYATENTTGQERSGKFEISGVTNEMAGYDGIANIYCAWTVTQYAGGGLPEQCLFKFRFNTFGVVYNNTQYEVEFEENPGSTSFTLRVPGADVGAGFNGTVSPYARDVQVYRPGGEGAAELIVSRTDTDAYVGTSYIFEGPEAGSGNFTVTLEVTFENRTDTAVPFKTATIQTGQSTQIDFYDWFNLDGEVEVQVSFVFTIS